MIVNPRHIVQYGNNNKITNNSKIIHNNQNNKLISTRTNDNIRFTGSKYGAAREISKLEKLLKQNKSLTSNIFDTEVSIKQAKELSNDLGQRFKQIILNGNLDLAEEFVKNLVKNPNACAEICSKNLLNENHSYESVFTTLLNESISDKALLKPKFIKNEAKISILRWEKLPLQVLLSANKAKPEVAEKMVMENLDNFAPLVVHEMSSTINAIKKILINKPDKYLELLKYPSQKAKISALEFAYNKGPAKLKMILDDVPLKVFFNIAIGSKNLNHAINFIESLNLRKPQFPIDATRLTRGFDYTTKMSAEARDGFTAKALYNSFKADKYSSTPYSQWNNLDDYNKSFLIQTVDRLLKGRSICNEGKQKLLSVIPF